MRFLLRLPGVRFLHQRQLLFPVVVLLLVIAVLGQGASLTDPPTVEPTAVVAEDPPPPRPVVRADLEKTPLAYFSDYWNQLAESAGPSLMTMGTSGAPAFLIGPRVVLTSMAPAREALAARRRRELAALGGGADRTAESDEARAVAGNAGSADGEPSTGDTAPEETVTDDGAEVEPVGDLGPFRLTRWDETLDLALFEAVDGDRTPFRLADPRLLPSGTYVAAVSVDADGRPTVAPGSIVAAGAGTTGGDGLVLSLDVPTAPSVAAVLDLDGDLIGLTHHVAGRPRILTAPDLVRLVDTLGADPVCRPIQVGDLSAAVRAVLGTDVGIVVERVDLTLVGPDADLRPGDVVTAWGADAEPVASVVEFETRYDAADPGTAVALQVLRAGETVSVEIQTPPARCGRPEPPEPVRWPRLGLAVEPRPPSDDPTGEADPAWQVVAVLPDGAAATGGVEEGDRLVAVAGVEVSREDRARLEPLDETEEPLLLTVRRGARTTLLVVTPPSPPAPPPSTVEQESSDADSEVEAPATEVEPEPAPAGTPVAAPTESAPSQPAPAEAEPAETEPEESEPVVPDPAPDASDPSLPDERPSTPADAPPAAAAR